MSRNESDNDLNKCLAIMNQAGYEEGDYEADGPECMSPYTLSYYYDQDALDAETADIAARVEKFNTMIAAGGGIGVARVRHTSWDNQPADGPIDSVIVIKIDQLRGGFKFLDTDNETYWDRCDDNWYLDRSSK